MTDLSSINTNLNKKDNINIIDNNNDDDTENNYSSHLSNSSYSTDPIFIGGG